jgi:hypothetical protein
LLKRRRPAQLTTHGKKHSQARRQSSLASRHWLAGKTDGEALDCENDFLLGFQEIAVGFLIALHKFRPALIGTVHSHTIRQGRA